MLVNMHVDDIVHVQCTLWLCFSLLDDYQFSARPGQERIDDPILVDLTAEDDSIESGSVAVAVDGKTDLDSVSLGSQASSTAETATTTGAPSHTHTVLSDTQTIKSTDEGGSRDGEGEGGRGEVERGGSKGQSETASVGTEEKAQSELQVGVAAGGRDCEGREGEGVRDGFRDQELLAEVFAGRESGAVEGKEERDGEGGRGEGRGRRGVGERGEGEGEGGWVGREER